MKINPFFEMLNFMYQRLLEGKRCIEKEEMQEVFRRKSIPLEYLDRYDELAGPNNSFFEILHNHTIFEKRTYYIRCEGIAYVTSYIDLREARKNAKIAIWVAIASFLLAAAVGGLQIWGF